MQLSRYIQLLRYHKTYRDKDDRFINLDNSKLPLIICIPDDVGTSWGAPTLLPLGNSVKTNIFHFIVVVKLQFAHFTGYNIGSLLK